MLAEKLQTLDIGRWDFRTVMEGKELKRPDIKGKYGTPSSR